MVRNTAFLFFACCILFSCSKSSSPAGPGASQPAATYLVVLNNLAETISLVNTKDWSAAVNAVGTGQVPNDADTAGEFLYIVNSQSSTLIKYRKTSSGIAFEASLNLGSATNPFGLSCSNQKIYVSCFMSDELLCVITNPFSVSKRISIGKSPQGVLSHGGNIFVACTAFDNLTYDYGQGYVYVINAAGDSVTDSIKVGKNPQDLTLAGGKIHVSCTGDWGVTVNGRIYMIDPASLEVTDSILIEGTPSALCAAGGDSVYVAAGGWSGNGEIYLYRQSGEILRGPANPIIAPLGVMDVCYFNGKVYAACFAADSLAQIEGDSVTMTWSIGDGPQNVIVW
ncbi:hypothetical protein JW890_07325 [candidate division WOR-3 bacterium]|nr:hypothetical protein [candidate division WOR-3 bacterium]